MKIGMLTQWYDPETGPAALPAVYAREFIRNGHEVKVLTGFPNYPEGKLYPGYSLRPRMAQSELPLQVTRVALYPNHNSSAVGRVANYASFALSASVLGQKALSGVDAIWVYNSPVTVAAPLMFHSKFGKTPIFLHVQDLWPDSLMESGMVPDGFAGKQAERAIAALVRLMETRSAVVGVISEGVKDLLLERNPSLDPNKIVYVPNPTNEQLFVNSGIDKKYPIVSSNQQPVEIMYAGAIGEVQGLDTVLEAAAILRDHKNIKFTFVGDGISRVKLEKKSKELNLSNVNFVGRVSQSSIPTLIARADIQLVSLSSSPFLAHTTPSKISSLLSSGVPIIAQIEGDGARLLEKSKAAVVVKPGDSQQMASFILKLVDQGPARWIEMGNAGRNFYQENLSAAAASEKIVDALEKVLKNSRRSRESR